MVGGAALGSQEKTAADRLETVGDYLAEFCSKTAIQGFSHFDICVYK